MRDYHRAMESTKREDWINGLRAVLPEKSDFEKAFIKDADDIFKMSEEVLYKFALDNLEKVAKAEIEYGALLKVTIYDIRKKERMSQAIRKDLEIIAPEVPLAEVSLLFERGSSGGTCLMWVNGRWVLIPEIGFIRRGLADWRKK